MSKNARVLLTACALALGATGCNSRQSEQAEDATRQQGR